VALGLLGLHYSRLRLNWPLLVRCYRPPARIKAYCIATFIPKPCPTLVIGTRRPSVGMNMKPDDLRSMSIEELWALHLEITSVLASRISAEKTQLEQRLKQLQSRGASNGKLRHERRPYPQVFPKYRNPAEPSETWAGRGKQPRWLTAQLGSGKKLDDFRIQPSADRARRSARR
jgi:DNA-binding protein H-NS